MTSSLISRRAWTTQADAPGFVHMSAFGTVSVRARGGKTSSLVTLPSSGESTNFRFAVLRRTGLLGPNTPSNLLAEVAAFANPEMYKFLEAGHIGYAIRLPANSVLQRRIGYLLKRPVGRPPHEVRHYASFTYRAQSWNTPRRVVAKVEWHTGELYPRVGFIVPT